MAQTTYSRRWSSKEGRKWSQVIYCRQWAAPAIPLWGFSISLPISVISPQCQYSQPESHNLGTFILMTVGYLWGLGIRIIKSSHSKAPLTTPNVFALADTVTIPANRDICFGPLFFCSLQFRVTFGFQGKLDLISVLVSFVHSLYPILPGQVLEQHCPVELSLIMEMFYICCPIQ